VVGYHFLLKAPDGGGGEGKQSQEITFAKAQKIFCIGGAADPSSFTCGEARSQRGEGGNRKKKRGGYEAWFFEPETRIGGRVANLWDRKRGTKKNKPRAELERKRFEWSPCEMKLPVRFLQENTSEEKKGNEEDRLQKARKRK